jgi:hypothetical protein
VDGRPYFSYGHKLNLCVYTGTVWHFESKEYLGKFCILSLSTLFAV